MPIKEDNTIQLHIRLRQNLDIDSHISMSENFPSSIYFINRRSELLVQVRSYSMIRLSSKHGKRATVRHLPRKDKISRRCNEVVSHFIPRPSINFLNEINACLDRKILVGLLMGSIFCRILFYQKEGIKLIGLIINYIYIFENISIILNIDI